MKNKPTVVTINITKNRIYDIQKFLNRNMLLILIVVMYIVSFTAFYYFYKNGLGIAYNDARSHLDIGRRVVEGLKPGFAQLGSVWLPLPHILMTLTIWNDFMWHSGLSGAIVSMISFVTTGVLIYKFLERLKVDLFPRIIAVFIFATNLNILYLQSTAMTELLLITTTTFAAYELLCWGQDGKTVNLIKSAFWIMLSTLVRYDGWFLLAWCTGIILIITLFADTNIKTYFKHNPLPSLTSKIKKNYKHTEGILILFLTLASFGVVLWFMWNLIIFKDPFYFALGPFSAKAQQDQLEIAGVLETKHNLYLSIKYYIYALVYNSNAFLVLLSAIGAFIFALDKKYTIKEKLTSSALLAHLFFNIIALYMGHSVLFIQGLSGDTWFNVRYGIMLMPFIAISIGYLIYKAKSFSFLIVGIIILVTLFAFLSRDAVTIDDALVGSSQKNVTEVSGWLKNNASDSSDLILISAASHDAIIFSSGLPMKRFIHEGTGSYWDYATGNPDHWAKWIIVRTYDDNDLVWKSVKDTEGIKLYNLVDHFPFADIYELKPEYVHQLKGASKRL